MLPLMLSSILGSLLFSAGVIVSERFSPLNGHVLIGYIAGGLLGAAIHLLYLEWAQNE